MENRTTRLFFAEPQTLSLFKEQNKNNHSLCFYDIINYPIVYV